MKQISSKTIYEGPMFAVRSDRIRRASGLEVDRDIVALNGAVAIVAYDNDFVYLIRQPREAVGEDELLELPAGTKEEGEDAQLTAERELAEEVGFAAQVWGVAHDFYPSPGCVSESITVFLATGLYPAEGTQDADEQIEIVKWPLADLDGAIAAAADGKTLIGLYALRERLG